MAEIKKNKPWITVLIIIIFFIFLILSSFVLLGWRVVKSSPKYSLYQLYKSVRNKNYNSFMKYVDLDAVVEHVLNQSSEDLTDLKDLSKTLLKRQIERGKFFGSDWIRTSNFIDFIKFWRSTKIKIMNTITQASISNDNQKINFNLKRQGKIWQIFNIDLEINQVLGLVKDRTDSQALTEEEQKLLHYFELKVKGFLAIKENKLSEGIKALEEVLVTKEDKTLRQYLDEAYFERGEYFYSIGEKQKALDDLNRCSKTNVNAVQLLKKINSEKK